MHTLTKLGASLIGHLKPDRVKERREAVAKALNVGPHEKVLLTQTVGYLSPDK
jgi:hypothetical protein